MVFLRYLTCLVAAVAVISYTVHLERNTPVVLKVKTVLGLDTSNLEAARAAQSGPGVIDIARAVLSGDAKLPSFDEVLAGEAKSEGADSLPEAIRGWMREIRPMDVASVYDFEDSFGVSAGDRMVRSDAMHDISGALYFRENMRMLITASDPDAGLGTASSVYASKADAGAAELVELGGHFVAVKRDRNGTYGEIVVPAVDGQLLAIRGNVPSTVMQSYLEAMPVLLSATETQEDANSYLHLVPKPLSGWSGEPQVFSHGDVLRFDASFAPDGQKKKLVAEESKYLSTAQKYGMRIVGGLYTNGDKRLLLTLTRLPDVTAEGNPLGGTGVLIGSGLMELTRTFEVTADSVIMLGDERLSVSRSLDGVYASLGRGVGGAYVLHLRGNVSDADMIEYVAALDLEALQVAAKSWNPNWNW